MKKGIIIQARTSSTRLPKKVLLKLPFGSKYTVLDQVINRCKLSKETDEVIIATTTEKEDDLIVKIAKKNNVKFLRGSTEDVLSRYYYAAKENNLDIVVRITSDCPCVDYQIIDKLIFILLREQLDYISNTIKLTFPNGLDVEVFNFFALEKAYKNAKLKSEREHVTPYICNKDNKFKIKNYCAIKGFKRPDIRITLDTLEDYALICSVYDYLWKEEKYFGLKEIIELFNRKPWLLEINKKILQKKVFKNLEEEKKEAIKLLRTQELNNIANILEKVKL
jgi:spore coat polysaccharide biosynthesis protein SpsF